MLSGDERRAVRRLCPPELAVQGHEPAPSHDTLAADETGHADGCRLPRNADDPREGEPQEQRQRPGDAERDREGHLVRVTGGVEEHAAGKLGIPLEKTVVNVDRYGNTSSGSIPLALTDARAEGRLRDGALILMTGMGAGLTWGSALMEWTNGGPS